MHLENRREIFTQIMYLALSFTHSLENNFVPHQSLNFFLKLQFILNSYSMEVFSTTVK